jgi:epoxyqueuosine reductase
MELREPMGLWVYGCDRCQNVCPRNAPWLANTNELIPNEKVVNKEKNFDLSRLLHMDKEYFESKIWPHMFYMSSDDIWRWKMNVARTMGNCLDRKYIPDLLQAFKENEDERVKGMIAWALGRMGGPKAKEALENFLDQSSGLVREEIIQALGKWQ